MNYENVIQKFKFSLFEAFFLQIKQIFKNVWIFFTIIITITAVLKIGRNIFSVIREDFPI